MAVMGRVRMIVRKFHTNDDQMADASKTVEPCAVPMLMVESVIHFFVSPTITTDFILSFPNISLLPR